MELLNSTPESHLDKVPLTNAVLAVKEINVNINEYKRRKDLGKKGAVTVKEVSRLKNYFPKARPGRAWCGGAGVRDGAVIRSITLHSWTQGMDG